DCVIAGNRIGVPQEGDPSAQLGFGAGMFCRRSSVRIQKSSVIGNTLDYRTSGRDALARDSIAYAVQGIAEPGEPLKRSSRIDPDGFAQSDDADPEARGGGLYLEECSVEIAGSTIQANAVYCEGMARGGGIWCERSRMRMWRSRVTDNHIQSAASEGAGIYFKCPLASELGGSVITGNGSAEGRGGGIFVEGEAAKVAIHRNSAIRQNHPDDIYPIVERLRPSAVRSP
ncbi:MAG TPA: hypothetical protein VJX67_16985, partial [Blastocatellia bacterium]|nr:hypothetical protein [Blastocatellia bacterium]